MGVHLISNNKNVSDLWLDGIKGKMVYKDASVVVSRSITVIKDNKGRLFTNLKNGAYAPSNWRFNDDLMKCLRLLGVLTQEDIDQHVALCKRKSEAYQAQMDRELLFSTCKKHGTKPPKTLIKKLNAAIDRG